MTTDIDPYALLPVVGVANPVSVTRVTEGADALLWRVETLDATYALRLQRAEQISASYWEAYTMRLADAAGIPVPHIFAEERWQGRPVMLLSWCEGRTLREELRQHPGDVWALGLIFGRTLAKIHELEVPDLPEENHVEWLNRVGVKGTALADRLRLLSQGRRDVIMHQDYHPLNVMVDGKQITGVLDWTNVALGDPRADVARTVMGLRLHWQRLSPPALEKTIVRILSQGFMTGYRQAGGCIDEMDAFYAWACLIIHRDLSGQMGRSRYQPEHLEFLFQQAKEHKRKAGIPV